MRRLALVFLAQCSLFPSLGDLTGGDASTIVESGADASTARFCDGVSPKPQYCEDFDEDAAPIPSSFESFTVDNGASLTLDTTDVRSAPRSLLVYAPAISSSDLHAAYYPTVGKAPSVATLSFDVKVDPGDTDAIAFGFVMNNGTSLLLVVGPLGVAFEEGGYAADPMYPRHPRYSVTWSKGFIHVDIKLTRDSSGHALSSLSLDGSPVETDYLCDARFVFADNLQIAIGYVYDGKPAIARSMIVDNIVAYDTMQ